MIASLSLLLATAPLTQSVAHGSEATAPPPATTTTPAINTTVALNPPTDRDMILAIADDRMLSDGSRAQFTTRYRLRFTLQSAGWRVIMQRTGVDCGGPATVCNAYRATMQPPGPVGAAWPEERFLVTSEGAVTAASPTARPPITGSPQLAAALAAARRDTTLIGGELRALLRFVTRDPAPSPSLDIVDGVLQAVEEQPLPTNAPGEPRATRTTRSTVSAATGLVTNATTSTTVADGVEGAEPTLLSRRTMTLQ
jgi:hypothetical protein